MGPPRRKLRWRSAAVVEGVQDTATDCFFPREAHAEMVTKLVATGQAFGNRTIDSDFSPPWVCEPPGPLVLFGFRTGTK
jgi:hypothetical protein